MASENVDIQTLKLSLDKVLKPVQHLIISRERLTGYKLIARGGFGSVSTAQLRAYSGSPVFQVVAVKELNPVGDDEERLKLGTSFARELRVWSRVDHPNVLPLIGFFLDTDSALAMFITPFEPHGNLLKYLERAKPNDRRRLDLALDTASGLLYLHTQEPAICHGDIKSLNVLVSADGRAKLCDFGLAKVVEEHPSGLTTTGFNDAATVRYISHELVCVPGARRSLRSDVWAWGGVSLEIFADQSPFGQCNAMQVYGQLLIGALPAPLGVLKVSDRIRELLRRCWEQDPDKRITMSACHVILMEEERSLPAFTEAERSESPIVPEAYSNQIVADAVLAKKLKTLKPYRLADAMIDYSDSYRGTLQRSFRGVPRGTSVVVRTFRARGQSRDWTAELRNYAHRTEIWIGLDPHPNILELLGFDVDELRGRWQWVSPWMDNGNLLDYIQRTNPDDSERIKLSTDVGRGLAYLHALKPPIAHEAGELRACNILVDPSGRAILYRFQLSKNIHKPLITAFYGTDWRWRSPELAVGHPELPAADMWAWGCVLSEIFVGGLPFNNNWTGMRLSTNVLMQEYPLTREKLSPLPGKVRSHIEGCWDHEPTLRPAISDGLEVLATLNNATNVTASTGVSRNPSTSTNGASPSGVDSNLAQPSGKEKKGDRLARVKRFFTSPRSGSD